MIMPAPCSNGTELLQDTSVSLEQWESQEAKQLALLRSENGSEVGNLLARRIAAHSSPALAAKQGNLGALRTSGVAGTRRGGSSALHYAVLYSQPSACEYLLLNGADPNCELQKDALLMHHSSALTILNATLVAVRNDWGCTPLHFLGAVAKGPKRDAIKASLESAGARGDVRGRSALWGGGGRPSSEIYECGGKPGRGMEYSKVWHSESRSSELRGRFCAAPIL